MRRINVALIGYGHLGKWHAQKASALETSNLVAIVELNKDNQEAAKVAFPDVKVVNSLDEVIDDIDAALVVTPTSFHAKIVCELLGKNKHVFCEKPLCSSTAELPLIKENLKSNLKLQVGHSERMHKAWDLITKDLDIIKSNKIIKIDRFAAFKGRATDVDVVQDLMIHDIDLMLFLFKSTPTKVEAIGFKSRTDKWDNVTAIWQFENGDRAIITSGRNNTREVRSLEISSDNGTIYVDMHHNEIEKTILEPIDKEYVEKLSYDKRDHLYVEQEAFYNSILNNQATIVDYNDGEKTVKLIEKVLESLELAKEIKI